MRIATSLLAVFSLAVVTGCRIPPGSDPYPEGKDVRVVANGRRSFVLHIAGTGGDCRALLAIGTVRRATPDSIYFTTLSQVDGTHLDDANCVAGRAGIMVFKEADAKPSVARVGPGSQTLGLVMIVAVLIGIWRFGTTSRM